MTGIDFWEPRPGGGKELSARNAAWVARAAVSAVQNLDHVVAISSVGRQMLALRANGTVWFWGESSRMSGSGTFFESPRQITGLSAVVAIASGNSHSLALDASGVVYAWGDNTYLQRGRREQPRSLEEPTQVPGLPRIKAIAAGMNNALALDEEGSVWEWGTRFMGNQVVNGRAIQESDVPRVIEGLPPARLIASGGDYSLAVAGGQLWAWGIRDNDRHWFPERMR